MDLIKKEEKKEEKKVKPNGNDPMYFVGMDPSYKSFAIVIIDRNGEVVEKKLLTSPSDMEPEDRIMKLEEEFSFIPNVFRVHTVHLEGISFASKGAFALQLAALHYYIRIFFRKHNINYKVVPPNTLKKYITGSGKSQKNTILLKTYKRWGVEFDSDDIADAHGLAQMSLEDFNNEKKKT